MCSSDLTGATSHLGSAPMDLAAKQRVEARQAEISKWVAEGKWTKCGSDQHWRRNCPKTTNRPTLTAAATASSSDSTGSTPYATAPPTPAASVTAESGKEWSQGRRLAPPWDRSPAFRLRPWTTSPFLCLSPLSLPLGLVPPFHPPLTPLLFLPLFVSLLFLDPTRACWRGPTWW